ncbi:MAG TPA: ATPase [Desulfobacteraceae bacterium]|nr:ATPase [Desulfobacteraceae bacterium]
MIEINEKIPNPAEIEKEIGEFLSKKFGGNIKVISPSIMAQAEPADKTGKAAEPPKPFVFNLIPEELVAHLDQYIVKQDMAKAILATKICTHFNRVKWMQNAPEKSNNMVGGIKNNILMIGPTGVGKTYMIKLIAKKIGVPFVKGDATKFSETGYVGGDVEDLIRDLVREADDNIELAQYGIIYIDEIDKIASGNNLIGADISRTGVQRALLKPMEETNIDLKVPHDPISMLQEIENFRKTGKREKRTINTKNILFIMSGAFSGLSSITKKRVKNKKIGFGAEIKKAKEEINFLQHVKSEDLVEFGFESEFVGRLPVTAIFEKLTEEDLYQILKNPNNPIILGKKIDFGSYGITIKFEKELLCHLAQQAFKENTGARGLVSTVEKALLLFEKRLPSLDIKKIAATLTAVQHPEATLANIERGDDPSSVDTTFQGLVHYEKKAVKEYIEANRKMFLKKYDIPLTPTQINNIASYYTRQIIDVDNAVKQVKEFYNDAKKLELSFLSSHNINIVLEEDAIDYLVQQVVESSATSEELLDKITIDFKRGLMLIRDKTEKNLFFITKDAILLPDDFISGLIKKEMKNL